MTQPEERPAQSRAQMVCELLETAERQQSQLQTLKSNITNMVEQMPAGIYPLDEHRVLVVYEVGKNNPHKRSARLYGFHDDAEETQPIRVEKRVRIEHYKEANQPALSVSAASPRAGMEGL